MKTKTKTQLMNIVNKFDKELREVLMSDLNAIKKGRIRFINELKGNSNNDGLLSA